MTNNEVLIGKIVNWPNMGDETSGKFIGCGRGIVVAILDPNLVLIRRTPRRGDTEPSYMFALSVTVPNLHFFDTPREEAKWFAWVVNDPKQPIVSLVAKDGE